jgi:hypothetical protein
LTLTQFAAFATQLTTLGKLYPQVNDLVEQWPWFLPSIAILSRFLFFGFFVFIVPHTQLGQLGGRLTGWPWRPQDTATQATA